MTTVVFYDGVLAADRRVTMSGEIVADAYRKVGVTHDDWLFAWCGKCADAMTFVEWAHGDRSDKPPKGDYCSLLISPNGKRVFEFEDGKILPKARKRKFFALGSGSTAALGALYAGATAKQAVLIAQKIDTSSGGGADTISISK